MRKALTAEQRRNTQEKKFKALTGACEELAEDVIDLSPAPETLPIPVFIHKNAFSKIFSKNHSNLIKFFFFEKKK